MLSILFGLVLIGKRDSGQPKKNTTVETMNRIRSISIADDAAAAAAAVPASM